MKKISQKNLSYSLLLAAVMMLFLISYFIFMLPSLYVDHMAEQNLEAVKKQHQAFVKQGNYDGVKVKNPTACISVKIPSEASYIEFTSKLFSLKIVPDVPEMKQLLAELQDFLSSYSKQKQTSQKTNKRDLLPLLNRKFKQCQHKLEELFKKHMKLPFQYTILDAGQSELFFKETFKIHPVSKQMTIFEASIEDTGSRYTNYLAVESVSDGMVFSVLPVITPEMGEIKAIVMQSLPMLIAVILMLILIFSQIYSNGIVSPILTLLQHTEAMKTDADFITPPLSGKWSKRQDEIGQLTKNIDALYQQLKTSFQHLRTLNQTLQEENKRQEIFLRASSHQLKTPVTAALLLLDGMIHEVGKYKNTKAYLPKVKEQLLSMREIIEEILSLNACQKDTYKCSISIYAFIEAQLESYHVTAAAKHLAIQLKGDRKTCLYADPQILTKILDNLLSNAVNYTPADEQILISTDPCQITIRNTGTAIPPEILPHIFEPFISGNHSSASHGLGLYIAAYYAKLMDAELTVQNVIDGVEAVLYYKSE